MKAPLKTVLKNFLDHVEDLEARKKVSDDQYESEFQELKKLTDKLKENPAYSSSFGLKDVNRPKNRYKDIVPYDFSRVILPKHEGVPGSDYINASYIKGASGAFAYIAAQGPLPNTVIDFWRMIWVCDVQVIVMACNEKEAGKFKCESYWPDSKEIKQYGNISIELMKTSQVCPDFLVRTFLVSCESEVRDVYHFHYTSWPDHGVPDTVQPILELVRLMRDCQASETVPIVVHCSAGCGRTGTICAVDYVWACLRHGRLDEDFSLYQIALELRRQRIAMIQTKEQYILAHKAVATMFEQQLKVIDCHIYENIDEDGEPLVWKEVGRDRELHFSNIIKKTDTKENTALTLTNMSDFPSERKTNSNSYITSNKAKKIQESSIDNLSHNSSVDNNLNLKVNPLDCVNNSSKNSESSYSRNSILSQQSNEDSIPFIDDDDVCVRPNCGRAYLDIPSCDSISKIMNCFDPFVDKVSLGTDDSSPDGDPVQVSNKMKDFQIMSNKTLDKNSKISSFKQSENKQTDSRSDNFDCSENAKKSSLFSYRESYPPCTNSDRFQKNFSGDVDKGVGDSSEDVKSIKKIGKATVVRRPSISKLKALFEKSSISSPKCSNDGSKRLLFRHNSHHVSRAGSAPPSLDCMDKSSAVERESILKIVTRKFRSSSVRTERELQSKQNDKTLNRRSATETVKDGFNALTRTVSFSLNKTFKSYSPSKVKPDCSNKSTASTHSDSVAGIYKPKSPDPHKSNSMWYDKSSLTRAVAVVKPTGKFDSDNCSNLVSKSSIDQKSPDKNKSQETHFNYITKPAKLKEFFSSLNKKDAKDATTLWYNETNTDTSSDFEKVNELNTKPDVTSPTTKSTSKVLPFLQMSSWKRVGPKSPLSSPDSPKYFSECSVPQNSKFYTDVLEPDVTAVNSATEKSLNSEVPKCPVPEEIIPIAINSMNSKFWPSNSLSLATYETIKSGNKSDRNILVCKDIGPDLYVSTESVKQPVNTESIKPPINIESTKQSVSTESTKQSVSTETTKQSVSTETTKQSVSTESTKQSVSTESTKQSVSPETAKQCVSTEPVEQFVNTELMETNIVQDIPPAIPKKMVIGKNKNLQIALYPLIQHSVINDNSDKANTEVKLSSEEATKENSILEKNDLYINVNIKAKKNIEQIENALRKNPRGAIIDLTSRESYSMEEELVNAVNQLSESSENNKVPSISSECLLKNKIAEVKSSSKFPGYEVIWPEEHCPIQKSKSSSKVPLTTKIKSTDKKSSNNLDMDCSKTGLCYSPPLRRRVNATLSSGKSQSCGNLDWLEHDYPNPKEQVNTPTKRLVNEAVVELNTLLNQLTTKTLSEDIDFGSKLKEKLIINDESDQNTVVKSNKVCNIEQNDTVVHSVTLVTKSYNSGSSPKEEEIVFHFPPPPRMPPPKDESPTESFEIVCTGGSLMVKETTKIDSTCNTPINAIKKDDTTTTNENPSENVSPRYSSQVFPQPAPRKSKQTSGLRRSSSYSNIGTSQSKNKGYENVFLEKYQTLSKLEIKPEYEHDVLDKIVPFQKSPILHKVSNKKNPGYVNIGDVNSVNMSNMHNTKPAISTKDESNKGETHIFNVSKNQSLHTPHKMVIDESENGNSVYGKIYKMTDRKSLTNQIFNDRKNINLVQDVDEVKKKPVHSKKAERAPLPPSMKQAQISNEVLVKVIPNNSMIPKKLPSRKLEKAPPPPNILQKSCSAINVPPKQMQSPQSYLNFSSSLHIEDKHKLPSVHENVPNVTENTQRMSKKISASAASNKFVNRGLSHSQSDVSVYLALKERRIQSVNQERKILNMESMLKNKRKTNDLVNMSSSDSDSSYERIFLTKNEPINISSKPEAKEQTEQITRKSYRKEIPVAPPRSKRRSTTEVQYTRVKAKDASHVSSTSLLLGETEMKSSESNSLASEDDPPAIPLKTKDAFEIPEESTITDMNKKTDDKRITAKHLK